MPIGIYDVSKRRKSAYPLKSRVICKKCYNVFFPDVNSGRATISCPNCDAKIDIRDKKGFYAKYLAKNPEKALARKVSMIEWNAKHSKERARNNRITVRKVIFNLLSNGKPMCANCGCDDESILEINHVNGGGTQEVKAGKRTNQFYLDIYKGRRKTDDLNLLCRVCNALHYLEIKKGKLPYTIIWNKHE